MTWKVIRKTPARGEIPARDIPSGSNIYSREDAQEIAAKMESWAAAGDGAKFAVEEEPRKV
jgi:hypothetical protein